MRAKDQKKLEDEFEVDIASDDSWEAGTVTPVRPRRPLGAQITVRLEPEIAELLRRQAKSEGIGYTALVRRFIIEALKKNEPVPMVKFESVGSSRSDQNVSVARGRLGA